MRSNIIVQLLLLVILAFCYGMDNETEPNDFESFVNRDIRINAANSGSSTAPAPAPVIFYHWVGIPVKMAIDQLSDTTYVNSDTEHFKSSVQTLTSQPKATSGVPGKSDSFQQPESAPFQPQLRPDQSSWMKKGKAKATSSASFKQPKSGRSSGTNFFADKPKAISGVAGTLASSQQRKSTVALIKSLINIKTHLKPNSGPSTAPIMPAQNSAMLYNSTGRTSMPMSHHQPSGTNFFMADANNSRTFGRQNSTGSQPFPTARGQSSAAFALPGGGGGADGTSTALQPGQSTWIRKGKAKATSSASFKQPKSGRSSDTNFSTSSQPFPTAHGQSSAALALPGGGADGTSTALQPDQSSPKNDDLATIVKRWLT